MALVTGPSISEKSMRLFRQSPTELDGFCRVNSILLRCTKAAGRI